MIILFELKTDKAKQKRHDLDCDDDARWWDKESLSELGDVEVGFKLLHLTAALEERFQFLMALDQKWVQIHQVLRLLSKLEQLKTNIKL